MTFTYRRLNLEMSMISFGRCAASLTLILFIINFLLCYTNCGINVYELHYCLAH